tara:strand:- start:15 stop:506 length:492 start_codon:yes stop_codon:yes gene_type:complete
MKKVLMSREGYIHEIVDPGQDYEIYNGPDAAIQWVDAPDEVTDDWTLEWSPSRGQMIWVERTGAYTDPMMARKVAYGDVGEQLDMMYKDTLDGGTRWRDHIAAVKRDNPRPENIDEPMTLEQLVEFSKNEEPGVDKPVGISTDPSLPAWKRYPGWSGYAAPDV